jgi:hypothetical protein
MKKAILLITLILIIAGLVTAQTVSPLKCTVLNKPSKQKLTVILESDTIVDVKTFNTKTPHFDVYLSSGESYTVTFITDTLIKKLYISEGFNRPLEIEVDFESPHNATLTDRKLLVLF